MSVEVKMPALSPTMEKGAIAKWLVKIGDEIRAGDLIAEIETDKATMEVESADEGVVIALLIAEGTQDVPVGTPIALIGEAGEAGVAAVPPVAPTAVTPVTMRAAPDLAPARLSASEAVPVVAPMVISQDRVKASPLARRLAAARAIELDGLAGSGPGGRIVKADLEIASPVAPVAAALPVASASTPFDLSAQRDIPHDVIKLSSMRKTIARRLTESKQQIPHIYLTVDVRLDALLALRSEINDTLGTQGIKLSVNDMLVKALALALIKVPQCNVSFAGDTLLLYQRADISVAVSIPNGLITPVVKGAEAKSLSAISTEIKELAGRAREGKLQPHEYQGGTASISNMGMFGIKQFDAVINPPQAMIMAIAAGERRPVVRGDQIAIETVMTVTGSFDHRAIDGADGAAFMNAFRRLIEHPLGMLV
jgi:pyruvate dehydrogenase E2 component (dihydrolipoamide acetyltransferase)